MIEVGDETTQRSVAKARIAEYEAALQVRKRFQQSYLRSLIDRPVATPVWLSLSA